MRSTSASFTVIKDLANKFSNNTLSLIDIGAIPLNGV
jgi:hypothetical protein